MSSNPSSVNIDGFVDYRSTSNIRNLSPFSLNENLNMKWDSSNRVRTRGGSGLFKNNTQWSGQKVLRFTDFGERDDTFFYVVAALDDGRLFYVKSDNANYNSPTVTWTEIQSTGATSPALSALTAIRDFQGFNDKLYVCDGTNNLYYVNFTTNQLVSVTVADLSTNNVVGLSEKSYRLVALDDAGKTHLSNVNDGTTFTAGESLNYGRVEGLRATRAIPFNDDLLITTEDQKLGKYQTYRLIGIQFPQFDLSGNLISGTEYEQFEVRKVNSIAGVVGDSAQEIASNSIGLTPRGFIFFGSVIDAKDRVRQDTFVSEPIKSLVDKLNFNRPDLISSCVDYVNGRYLCSVPSSVDATKATSIFVYDFDRSRPEEGVYRWALWTFNWNEDNSITHLGTIKGVPYASDGLGNIFRIDDSNLLADNGNPINCVVKTGGIGGKDLGTSKTFHEAHALFTDLSSEDIEMTVKPFIDGILEEKDTRGDFYKSIKVQRPSGVNFYDTGLRYDSFNYYDEGGTDQRIVTMTHVGGKGQMIQHEFSTNTTGITWGLGGFNVKIGVEEQLNESGVNFGGF